MTTIIHQFLPMSQQLKVEIFHETEQKLENIGSYINMQTHTGNGHSSNRVTVTVLTTVCP